MDEFSVAPLSAEMPQPNSDNYEKPASVSSVTSEHLAPPVSPHYFYVLHFPIQSSCHSTAFDPEGTHESNQRAVLLFGFGRSREQARQGCKRLQKDIQRMLNKKGCYEIIEGRLKGPKVDLHSTYTSLRQRFLNMAYFDRYIISNSALTVLMDSLNTFLSGKQYMQTRKQIWK